MTFRRTSAALALAAALALPGAAGAMSWRAPVRLAGPFSTDVSPVTLAVSASGQVAAGFSRFDEDRPASSQAWLAVRGAHGGRARTRRVPGAQQVLGAAWSGTALELLTGSAPSGLTCCSETQLVGLTAGRFGAAHRIAGRLTGATAGALEVVPSGGLLAAVATDRGVWVARAARGPRLGRARTLGPSGAVPWTMAAAASSVAWLSAPDASGESGPAQLLVAGGSPPRARPVLNAAPGHELDELALAEGRAGRVSAAWTDAWFDSRGAYHSQVEVADLAGRVPRPRALAVPGQTASGLAFAGGGGGRQVVAFKSCDADGACWAQAAFRDAGGRFAALVRLGAIDPGQAPAVTVTADGTAVVAWVWAGEPFAAVRGPGARGFGRAHRLSSTRFAADLTLAAGTDSEAVAAWTQGTVNPSVVEAELR